MLLLDHYSAMLGQLVDAVQLHRRNPLFHRRNGSRTRRFRCFPACSTNVPWAWPGTLQQAAMRLFGACSATVEAARDKSFLQQPVYGLSSAMSPRVPLPCSLSLFPALLARARARARVELSTLATFGMWYGSLDGEACAVAANVRRHWRPQKPDGLRLS